MRFATGLLLSIFAIEFLAAAEPPQEEPAAGDKNGKPRTLLKTDECQLLIEQLASKSEPPFAENARADLPRGLRESDLIRIQQPIRKAYADLSDNIEVALPLLVEHANDKRFSYVYESISGAFVKASVGSTCRRLVYHHIEVYGPHVRSFGGSGTPGEPPFPRKPAFIADAGGLEKWAASRKEKSLAELQIEAIEWAIRFEKQQGFSNAAEEERIVPSLEKQAAEIRRSSQPILRKPAPLFFFGK